MVCDCHVNGAAPPPNVVLDSPRPCGLQHRHGLGVNPHLTSLPRSHPGDAPATLDVETLKGFHVVWRRDLHLSSVE